MKQIIRIALVFALAAVVVIGLGKSYMTRVEAKRESIRQSVAFAKEAKLDEPSSKDIEDIINTEDISHNEDSDEQEENQFKLRMQELTDEIELVGTDIEEKFSNLDDFELNLEDTFGSFEDEVDFKSDDWEENLGDTIGAWGVSFGETMAEFGTSLGDSLEETFTD